ncbi:hypothetical protein LJ658_20325 [Mucilaginibacter sp. UR6-11]|nr:hypothetical protein [Mucilaginibacter sp. UR6-11]
MDTVVNATPVTTYYSGGNLPEPVEYKFDDPDIKTPAIFKNPYGNVMIKGDRTIKKEEEDKKNIDDLITTPAAINIQNSNTSFDYKASHTDRFINSPCYHELGFDPQGDIIQQEKVYSDCEATKENKNIFDIEIIVLVVLGLGVLLFFALYKEPKKSVDAV